MIFSPSFHTPSEFEASIVSPSTLTTTESYAPLISLSELSEVSEVIVFKYFDDTIAGSSGTTR